MAVKVVPRFIDPWRRSREIPKRSKLNCTMCAGIETSRGHFVMSRVNMTWGVTCPKAMYFL